ncbi:MAG: DUF4382 domain-containing protein [Gammaproteobacteria bacterium]|nr:DUF4382 domain-containing protein [Gammaproteobacteria bacterium]
MNTMWKTMVGTGLAAALVACGGGGGGSGGGSDGFGTTGELNLAITDAPVDGAEHVWITITGVKLKRTGTDEEKLVDVIGNEITVDLLALSNGTTRLLFTESIAAGEYQWARFQLSDARIVWEGGGEDDLQLPTQDELKTSGNFSVPSNGVAHYTVDWDLRKSIVEMGGSGNYKLKPVLHLRDDDNVGYIQGYIDETYTVDACTGETDIPTLYVYNGHAIVPDDMGGAGVEPIASTKLPVTGDFYLGMLNPGNYTLAFTCNGDMDDPETDETNLEVEFPDTLEVTVIQGENVEFEDTDYPFRNLLQIN